MYFNILYRLSLWTGIESTSKNNIVLLIGLVLYGITLAYLSSYRKFLLYIMTIDFIILAVQILYSNYIYIKQPNNNKQDKAFETKKKDKKKKKSKRNDINALNYYPTQFLVPPQQPLQYQQQQYLIPEQNQTQNQNIQINENYEGQLNIPHMNNFNELSKPDEYDNGKNENYNNEYNVDVDVDVDVDTELPIYRSGNDNFQHNVTETEIPLYG